MCYIEYKNVKKKILLLFLLSTCSPKSDSSSMFAAFVVGGRWKYFWIGTIVHGITTELVAFAMPDIDNYWHSQTAVIFLGRRLPLHIPLICESSPPICESSP